jgi:hypothetical protein
LCPEHKPTFVSLSIMPLSRGLKIVLGGWTAFAGSHLALSHPPIRSKLIESTSEGQFRGTVRCRSSLTVSYVLLLSTSYFPVFLQPLPSVCFSLGLHSALTCSIIGASSYLYNKTPKVAQGPLLHSLSKRSGVVAGSCLLKVIGALFVVDAIITPFPGNFSVNVFICLYVAYVFEFRRGYGGERLNYEAAFTKSVESIVFSFPRCMQVPPQWMICGELKLMEKRRRSEYAEMIK